ncbi:MAG: L-histidine N(alpha)-methyltransferase [Cytophagales bacterium]|nr:L-histidine N(alpha)-methyltransferase [Armatimonadota bacterium]
MPSYKSVDAPLRVAAQTLTQAVLAGLSQNPRTLPCRFFYDEAGSVLFERICDLPEYYPTRTEHGLLERYADQMIQAASFVGDSSRGRPLTLIELGSGSSYKTRLLIEAALRAQNGLHYLPIDISGEFLRECAAALLAAYGEAGLSVTAVAAEYHDAITLLPTPDGPRLFLFLGSNIGNFCTRSAADLLSHLRREMTPQDRLLIGVDLVKDITVLEAAYNDAAGVTAAFNKNLLTRLNREMGADFDFELWEHHAPYNADASRIEMWLRSGADQVVTLFGEDGEEYIFPFRKGEGIHTENSHKYTPETFAALCRVAGLRIEARWTDPQHWFASFLLRPEGGGK